MSHCTRFDFSYTNEDAIVKAFRKLNIKCSTEMVCEYASDLGKMLLSKLGYAGHKQYRAIVGQIGNGHLFLCKVEENNYKLFVEHPNSYNESEDKIWADKFKNAYIEVAVDKVLHKFDLNATRYKVERQSNGMIVRFGPNLEYTVSVLTQDDSIVEEVSGVTGDFCTKLTEDIEDMLSHPMTELRTEWKTEVNLQIEDEALQVLSLNF